MAVGYPIPDFDYLASPTPMPPVIPTDILPQWFSIFGLNPMMAPFQAIVHENPLVPGYAFQTPYERTGFSHYSKGQIMAIVEGFRAVLLEAGGITLFNLLENGQARAQILNQNTADRIHTLPNQSGTLQNNPYALTSAGTSNAFTLTPTVPIVALVAGLQVLWIADRAPTGSSTLNVSGLGAQPIQLGATAVTSGQWVVGQALTTMWDGSAWQLISGGGGSGGGTGNNWLGWQGF